MMTWLRKNEIVFKYRKAGMKEKEINIIRTVVSVSGKNDKDSI